MYELGYCSFLLLLCERKVTTFSKDNIRYEYVSYAVHTHQHEFANFSLPCEGRFKGADKL